MHSLTAPDPSSATQMSTVQRLRSHDLKEKERYMFLVLVLFCFLINNGRRRCSVL
jgi:hypothetical protein